jgi:hypothetical protein
MGRMTDIVPETQYQSLQHLTNHPPSQHRPVMDKVTLEADHLLGDSPDNGIVLDESSLPEKGTNLSELPVNVADDTARSIISRLGFIPHWFTDLRWLQWAIGNYPVTPSPSSSACSWTNQSTSQTSFSLGARRRVTMAGFTFLSGKKLDSSDYRLYLPQKWIDDRK